MIVQLLIILVVLISAIRIVILFSDKISFFANGNEKGFKFSEICSLWRLAKETNLEDPSALFFSSDLFNNTIIRYTALVKENGTENLKSTQDFLESLYNYRTRISLERENKKGLDSTRYLDKKQKLRVLLPGEGVFQSELLENAGNLVIKTPTKDGKITISSEDWIGKKVSVYLWRKCDAAYVFDSVVKSADIYMGASSLRLEHSNELIRTQKRKSIRIDCKINAQLYFLEEDNIDYNVVETASGFKCILENVSEDGALIRVGGRGVSGTKIKIQFYINETLIVMFGVIRDVEYNSTYNQSKLHFQCEHIDKQLKNLMLAYVYNLLPEEKKEEVEAMTEVEKDANSEESEGGEAEEIKEVENLNSIESIDQKVENVSKELLKDDSEEKRKEEEYEELMKTGIDEHLDARFNELKAKMEAMSRS